MNCLVPAQGYRAVCVSLAWMLAVTGVSGQTTKPSTPSTGSAADISSVSPSNQTDLMIARIRVAMNAKDYHTAVQSFRAASQQSGSSPRQLAEIEMLKKQLEQIGVDSALLAQPAKTMSPAAKKKEDTDKYLLNCHPPL